MRVTLINQFYTPDVSPTAHLCAALAEHRAARGDDVSVLTSRAGYASPLAPGGDSGPKSAVHVRRLWSTRFGSRSNLGRLLDWMTFYIPAFWAAVTMPRQDVVIALTTPPFIALAGWLHKLLHPRARLILWNMDVYPEALERTKLIRKGGVVGRLMRSTHRAIFHQLDHLVSLDGAMSDLLLSQYMSPHRPFRHSIVPNWESLELFPARSPGSDSREKFVVLYLGNAGYGHEFQTVIDAAAAMRNQPITFLFIGGGSLRPWIENAAKQQRLSNITFRDYVPKEQTPAIMLQADLALITLEDSMLGVMSPSKLHANLAMGLPILYIGPAGSNVDEAISRFQCGISLRPGQAAEMAEFVLGMMNDRASQARLRQLARHAFEQAYCDDRALAKFDDIIDSPSLA